MKLIVNRTDIENFFAAKAGLEPHQIQIDIVSEPIVPSMPVVQSIASHIVRDAIDTIFTEAYNAGASDNAIAQGTSQFGRKSHYINRIALIKAVRALTHETSLKDAKDFVEDVLVRKR
jgi:ribosomal protein L7/L12